MPARAPRICSCGKVVPAGAICPCQAARKAARDAKHDRKRGTSSQRGYTGTWDRESRAFLRRNRSCIACGAPADVVDHKTPHRGDRTLFWDRSNWQPLCTPCHSRAKQRLERRQQRTQP